MNYGTVVGVCGGKVYVQPDGSDTIITLPTKEFREAEVNPIKGLRLKYRGVTLVGVQVLCWKAVPAVAVPEPEYAI